MAGLAYLAIPMYLNRWRADRLAGRSYFTLAQGLHDLATRWVVTRQWSDWHTEVPWMTLYSSAAVWLSIALAVPSAPGSDLLE